MSFFKDFTQQRKAQKQRLVEVREQENLNRTLDLIKEITANIGVLEQEKLYWMNVGEQSEAGMTTIRQAMKLALQGCQWTPPRIILTNRDIKELDLADLKGIIRQKRKEDKDGRSRKFRNLQVHGQTHSD